VRLWRTHWAQFVPFLVFPPEVRRVIYTTNLIESMNARLPKVTRNRGQFPTEQAGWIQLASATPGGLSSVVESSCWTVSAGVRQPRRLRGLLLSSAATNSR
jgi:Transposase, Mutator family